MKKQWKKVLGIGVAASLLTSCGTQTEKIRGVEILTANMEAFQREAAPGQEGEQEELIDESMRVFSYKLMVQCLNDMEQENPVFAPVSAYIALSMAATGAQGETAAELEELLGVEHKQISERCITLLQNRGSVELEIADSAWLDQQLQAKETWLAEIQNSYKGEVYRTDLSARQARKAINTWAKDHTQGLIKDFLQRPLPEDARLILLNALYLKAGWRNSFDGYATRKQTWYREDGKEKQVSTMHKGMAYFPYVADADMDGVILPFQGEELVFLAIRPQEGKTARELYEQLKPERIVELLAGQEKRPMNLSLPKFTVACDQELNALLQELGVERAFEPEQADFSNLGTDQEGLPIYVSLVRQKAMLELNEEGIKAGAVTSLEMRAGSAMPSEEPVEMNLDHPFVYMILDLETQVPLFIGILDDPS